jgi:hypothetical protein
MSGFASLVARKELHVKLSAYSKDVVKATERLKQAAQLCEGVSHVSVASL